MPDAAGIFWFVMLVLSGLVCMLALMCFVVYALGIDRSLFRRCAKILFGWRRGATSGPYAEVSETELAEVA